MNKQGDLYERKYKKLRNYCTRKFITDKCLCIFNRAKQHYKRRSNEYFSFIKDFFYRSLFSRVCYIVFFNFFHFTGISFSFHPIIIVLFAGIFVGVATFGILSVIYGILFTIIQTQVIYLLNKSHKVNAKILKPTH